MSLIDLQKKVSIVLEKRKLINPPPTRVGLAIDGSGSMKHLYRNGVVQKTVDRLLAVASKFDDDGNLDAWMFDGYSYPLPQATPADYNGYVESKILSKYKIDGGTRLAPVIGDITEFYFPVPQQASKPGLFSRLFGAKPAAAPPQETSTTPVFIMVITDGENADKPHAGELLRECAGSEMQIYWQMVGIGEEGFTFLRGMADELPNVGFCEIRDIGKTSDEALYEKILSQEFVDWIRA